LFHQFLNGWKTISEQPKALQKGKRVRIMEEEKK
jgi:hypothetical protein